MVVRGSAFQQIRPPGAGFETGDFVKEKLVGGGGGGATVERLPPAVPGPLEEKTVRLFTVRGVCKPDKEQTTDLQKKKKKFSSGDGAEQPQKSLQRELLVLPTLCREHLKKKTVFFLPEEERSAAVQ